MLRFEAAGLRYHPGDPRGGGRRGAGGESWGTDEGDDGHGPPSGRGGGEALRDVTLDLADGSFTWLVGESGAGKTTLLRLMGAALRPTSGEAWVMGVPLSRAPRAALPPLRRRIGALHAEHRLLPYLTAFDNVALPLRLARRAEASVRADVGELLRWVGLADRAGAMPATLSGGEQRRVALARAVVARPALLLADEPTSGLDARAAARVMALLAALNATGGATVVVATHDAALVEAHPEARVVALREGRVAVEPAVPAEGGGGRDDRG